MKYVYNNCYIPHSNSNARYYKVLIICEIIYIFVKTL